MTLAGGLIIGIAESMTTLIRPLAPYRSAAPFVVAAILLLWLQRNRKLTFSAMTEERIEVTSERTALPRKPFSTFPVTRPTIVLLVCVAALAGRDGSGDGRDDEESQRPGVGVATVAETSAGESGQEAADQPGVRSLSA